MPTFGDWLDIETAPKEDSKIVLLHDPTILGDAVQAGYWFEGYPPESDPETGWHWIDALDTGPMDPTHWMPLPEPPK